MRGGLGICWVNGMRGVGCSDGLLVMVMGRGGVGVVMGAVLEVEDTVVGWWWAFGGFVSRCSRGEECQDLPGAFVAAFYRWVTARAVVAWSVFCLVAL